MMWEEYKKKISNKLIPLMEVMGNKVFDEQFHNNPDELYAYCIKNRVKWEDVIDFNPIYSADIDY